MAMKKTGRATSTTQGLIWGLAVSIFTTFIAAFSLAKMVDQEIIGWNSIGYIILFVVILASFFGAFISCRKIKRQRLVNSMISGAIYWLTLIVLTAIFFGGEYDAIAATGASIGVGSLIGCLMSSPISAKRKSRKYKLPTR